MAAKFPRKKYKSEEVLEILFGLPSDDESVDDLDEGDGEITLPSTRSTPNVDDIEPSDTIDSDDSDTVSTGIAACRYGLV